MDRFGLNVQISIHWSTPVTPVSISEHVNSEERRVISVHKVSIDHSMLHKYQSLLKLKRVTAYCLRFVANSQAKKFTSQLEHSEISKPEVHPLTPNELERALHVWIKLVQQNMFPLEIRCLSEGNSIPLNSNILPLCPFLVLSRILRVGGRLRHAKISIDQKTPIILPRHHRLTQLIIDEAHIQNLHAGPQLIQGILAQRFWIIRARDAIRYRIKKCVRCARHRATTQHQLMGDLPSARVNPSRPFSTSGVDYAEPFILRPMAPARSKCSYKGYLALFICFPTRALHLEVVSSLTTEGFLQALRRFVSRRGRPREIFSDCGTNFVGAVNDMKEFVQLIKSEAHNQRVADQLSSQEIKWNFNPLSAPHFGGLWEAGVKSVKYHLQRVVGTARLNFEELTTVMTQVEACLNSRPLTPMSSDPTDLTALTPAHFLIGDSLKSVAEPDYTMKNPNRLLRWQMVQQLSQHFWKRWSQEFITRLQQRPKWLQRQRDIQVGDMVLVKSDGLPPTIWPLARVLQLHPGTDGMTRVVTVKTATNEMKRPIIKLCLLPLDIDNMQESHL